ncbi:MAG: putative solute-binding protein [Pseudomonadota bacterium]
MNRPLLRVRTCLFAVLLSLASGPAAAADATGPNALPAKIIKAKFCVFDIAGAHGDIYRTMQDYRIEMLKHGVDFELIPYTSEKIAAEDFKAGICDAVDLTSFRARNFIKSAGTIDAIGALPTTEHVRLALAALADPRSAAKLRSGPYEVAGIVPIGAAYIFTRDRRIDSLTKAAGKRVAVLDYDPTQAKLVSQLGAAPVPSDITNFSGKFNNGSVDIIAAPLAAYRPLELYKGLEPSGGIIDYPFTQLTAQVLVRSEKFDPAMLQYAREQVYRNFDKVLEILAQMSKDVPAKYWVKIPEPDKIKYETMMRDARIQLRDEGYYDGDMLSLLRKVRCKVDSSRAECTDKKE